MTIPDLLQNRYSASFFDPTRTLSEAEIQQLVSLATTAPSAFNAQNWRFIAVRSSEQKERLKKLAYMQAKVSDTAVTFIVCGETQVHRHLGNNLRSCLEAQAITQTLLDNWVGVAEKMYGPNPQFQRDEAVRSASLAGMTLMVAAHGLGLAAGPMIGFDPAGVAREFGLSESEVPVMLIAVGHPTTGNAAQKPRRPLHEVLVIR